MCAICKEHCILQPCGTVLQAAEHCLTSDQHVAAQGGVSPGRASKVGPNLHLQAAKKAAYLKLEALSSKQQNIALACQQQKQYEQDKQMLHHAM